MIVFAVAYLLALAAAGGAAVQASPNQVKGCAFTLTIVVLLISGIVLAVGQL